MCSRRSQRGCPAHGAVRVSGAGGVARAGAIRALGIACRLNLVVAVVDEERYAGHAAVNRAEALVAGRRVRGVAVGLAGAAIERVPAWLHGDIGLLELEIDGAWDMADDVRPKNFFLEKLEGFTPLQ